jgi:hypothetical protein
LPQGGHATVLEAVLISTHRASGTTEDPRNIVLVSPALLNQRDPRVGFGDAIAHRVVCQHDSGNDYDPPTIIGTQQTSIIDDLRARRDRESLPRTTSFTACSPFWISPPRRFFAAHQAVFLSNAFQHAEAARRSYHCCPEYGLS